MKKITTICFLSMLLLVGCSETAKTEITEVYGVDAMTLFSEGYAFYGVDDATQEGDLDITLHWGIIDSEGNKITEPNYANVGGFFDGLSAVSMNNESTLYGYTDTEGEMAIEPIFVFASDFSEGVAAVCQTPSKYYYINKDGSVAVEGPFDIGEPFSEGMAAVKSDNLWGFIDINGVLVIPYDYDEVSDFHSGLAYAVKDGQGNIINQQNELILSDISIQAYSIDGYFIIEKDEKTLLIDNSGAVIKDLTEYDFDYSKKTVSNTSGRILFKENSLYGYLDLNGDIVIKATYSDARVFSNGYAIIRDENGFGYINTDGKVVIEPQYDAALPVSDTGYAVLYGKNREIYMTTILE